MRGAYIIAINDTKVSSEQDITAFFESNKEPLITLHLGTIEKQAMHPDDGVPIMYFDQLNMISQHLREIKYGKEVEQAPQAPPPQIPTDDS